MLVFVPFGRQVGQILGPTAGIPAGAVPCKAGREGFAPPGAPKPGPAARHNAVGRKLTIETRTAPGIHISFLPIPIPPIPLFSLENIFPGRWTGPRRNKSFMGYALWAADVDRDTVVPGAKGDVPPMDPDDRRIRPVCCLN